MHALASGTSYKNGQIHVMFVYIVLYLLLAIK